MASANSSFLVLLFVTVILTVTAQGQGQESLCQTIDSHNKSVPGFCINIKFQLRLCPTHYALLKNKDWVQLQKHICSPDNKRVCCPITEFNEVQVTEEERVNQINFRSHPGFRHLPNLRSCGQSFRASGDRVLGGNVSQPGEFPWVARIGMRSDDNPAIQYTCGGSIISKRYILTAAHCFKQPHLRLVHVRLGQSDEEKEEECIDFSSRSSSRKRRAPMPIPQFDGQPKACAAPIDLDYEEIVVHPEYTRQVGSYSDIALIRLAEEVNIDSFFTRPICLPFLNEYQVKGQLQEAKVLRDEKTLVAGFGKVHNDEQIGSSTLQFVKSAIQPNIMCRISYPSFNVSSTQICAGGDTGSGSCLGDSGGPMFLPATPQGSSRALRSFQLGIVSYGKATCGQQHEPVVYTKVRSYLKWILDNIRA